MVSRSIFSGITEIRGCSCVFPMERFRVLYQLIISVFDELRRKRPYYHNTVRGLILAMMVELSRSTDWKIPFIPSRDCGI